MVTYKLGDVQILVPMYKKSKRHTQGYMTLACQGSLDEGSSAEWNCQNFHNLKKPRFYDNVTSKWNKFHYQKIVSFHSST